MKVDGFSNLFRILTDESLANPQGSTSTTPRLSDSPEFPQDILAYLSRLMQTGRFKEAMCPKYDNLDEAIAEFLCEVPRPEIVVNQEGSLQLKAEYAHHARPSLPDFATWRGIPIRIDDTIPPGEIWLVGRKDGEPRMCRIVNVKKE